MLGPARTSLAAVLLLGGLLVPGPAGAEPPDTCAGLPVTVMGTDGNDDLSGTEAADVVSLGAGADRFRGQGGADVVCGGPGDDMIDGNEGDDRVYGEAGDDSLTGSRGDDLVDGGADDDYLRDDQLGSTLAGVDGEDVMIGGDGDDRFNLFAGDGDGAGGADEADGGGGADSVSYASSPVGVVLDAAAGTATGDAVDLLVAMEGPYWGSQHPDELRGTPGDDVLDAEAPGLGSDAVFGLDGDDRMTADVGVVDGGAGDDMYDASGNFTRDLDVLLGDGADLAEVDQGLATTVIRGGQGPDVVEMVKPETGSDSDGLGVRLLGGPGTDLLSFRGFHQSVDLDAERGDAVVRDGRVSFRFFDEFAGSAQADTLRGGPEADRITGLGGADVLAGRGGRDVLVGGAGRDRAHGGDGRDTCTAERRVSCEA